MNTHRGVAVGLSWHLAIRSLVHEYELLFVVMLSIRDDLNNSVNPKRNSIFTRFIHMKQPSRDFCRSTAHNPEDGFEYVVYSMEPTECTYVHHVTALCSLRYVHY